MIWDILKNYFVVLLFGVAVGFLISRRLSEETNHYSLGKTIEGSVISRRVSYLSAYCNELDSLLSNIRIETDALLDQIHRFRDIETVSYDPKEYREVIDEFYSIKNVSEKIQEETNNKEELESNI
jgi:hypothetical protein